MTQINLLSIAGLDPSGGAGILADVKTFYAHQCHGLAVLSVLTAQNSFGISATWDVPTAFFKEQLKKVLEEVEIHAVKIGALGNKELISVTAQLLQKYKVPFLILDPVLLSTSGVPLLKSSAIEALKEELFPLATTITPNLPEAKILLGGDVSTESRSAVEHAAELLLQLGPRSVVLKGGHQTNTLASDDLLVEKRSDMETLSEKVSFCWFTASRIFSQKSRGTGCVFASALATHLALGKTLRESVQAAKDFVRSYLVSFKSAHQTLEAACAGKDTS